MKAACFATVAAYQVKNLFTSLGGQVAARQHVMENKWNAFCADFRSNNYDSIDQCYLENNDAIQKDVDAITKIIEEQQESLKDVAKDNEVPGKGIFGGDRVDSNAAYEDQYNLVKSNSAYQGIEGIDANGNKLVVKEVLTDDAQKYFSSSELRELELNMKIINSNVDDDLKDISRREVYNSLSYVNGLKNNDIVVNELATKLEGNGYVGSSKDFDIIGGKEGVVGSYNGNVVGTLIPGLKEDTPTKGVVVNGEEYILHLGETQGEYYIEDIYHMDTKTKLGVSEDTAIKVKEQAVIDEIRGTYKKFIQFDSATYRNRYNNPEIRYFETEPYKGLPHIVPFDVNEGWYAGTKQILPAFGNIKAFQDSGRPNSFWVCNVGKNGNAEFDSSGFGDDICMQFNAQTGQPITQFRGLKDGEAEKIITSKISAKSIPLILHNMLSCSNLATKACK